MSGLLKYKDPHDELVFSQNLDESGSPLNEPKEGQEWSYLSRPAIEQDLAGHLTTGRNFVLHGPSHQGKTTLLARYIPPGDSIYIECRPEFKRAQIYRVLLSSLGYAVLIEKKKRGKASSTVQLGIAKVGAEGGVEQTMQPVTVDLKNPSEVAQLISSIKRLPWIILNNFQLLDTNTKRTLLFDLTFFAERPNMRIAIVGGWSNEEYLEEIEPAITDKFVNLLVPFWSDNELRAAVEQWFARSESGPPPPSHVDELLTLAAGDISLFRALLQMSLNAREPGRGAGQPLAVPVIQAKVVSRFRRGFNAKLAGIFSQRDCYLEYLYPKPSMRLVINPAFQAVEGKRREEYLRTTINPYTNRAYPEGRFVLLDDKYNPQYIERESCDIEAAQTNFARYLLRSFHAAANRNSNLIPLAQLVQDFKAQLAPPAVSIIDSRLKAALVKFIEAQRQALVVPPMLTLNANGDAMEMTDRRLFLFLQSIELDDLDELMDAAEPRNLPEPRKRNHISEAMTQEDKSAYVAKLEADVDARDDDGQGGKVLSSKSYVLGQRAGELEYEENDQEEADHEQGEHREDEDDAGEEEEPEGEDDDSDPKKGDDRGESSEKTLESGEPNPAIEDAPGASSSLSEA